MLGEMCVVLFDEPDGSRRSGLLLVTVFFAGCLIFSACSAYAVPFYRCLGEMCVVLFDEPDGSRMTHLPPCERQPLWEGRERI